MYIQSEPEINDCRQCTYKPFAMNTSLAPSKGKSTLMEDQFASWKWYGTVLFPFT